MAEDYSPEENDQFTPRLSAKDFAQNLYDKGEFVVVLWDVHKYRLGQRMKYLMLLGYQPYGNMESHVIYENSVPIKCDMCIIMINKALYNKELEG